MLSAGTRQSSSPAGGTSTWQLSPPPHLAGRVPPSSADRSALASGNRPDGFSSASCTRIVPSRCGGPPLHASWSYLSVSSVLPQQPYAWIAGLMSNFTPPWFICGGWAVDAWLGRRTREHGDFDITVFHHDQTAALRPPLRLEPHRPRPQRRGRRHRAWMAAPWTSRPTSTPPRRHSEPRASRSLVRTPGSQSRDGRISKSSSTNATATVGSSMRSGL